MANQYVAVVETRGCTLGDCTKAFFATGPISDEPRCGAHYQRERRQLQANKPRTVDESPVRHYGTGSNHISTRVEDHVLTFLKDLAQQKYGGDLAPLLRDIIVDFYNNNQAR